MGIGATGQWVAGQKSIWGWVISLLAQPLWIIYAVATEQYGFIVGALVYGSVSARNLLRWHREEREAKAMESTA